MRGPLAGEVGQKEETFRAGRCLRGQRRHHLVVLSSRGLPPPAQRAARRQRDAHQVIPTRHRVAESVEPAPGVDARRRAVRKNHSTRAYRRADQALAHYPVSNRRRRVVARTRGHGKTSGQPGRRGGRGRDVAGEVGTFMHRGQPGWGNLERRHDLSGPGTAIQVEQQRARCVRGIGRVLTGQAKADVVLRQKKVVHAGVGRRLLLAQPQHLGRLKSGDRGVARDLDQPGGADFLGDGPALVLGPLVAPQQGRADHAIAFVQEHRPVHLPRQPKRQRRMRKPGDDTLQNVLARAPPLLGVLLGPSRTRDRERIRGRSRGDNVAEKVDGDRTRSARSDVQPDQRTRPDHLSSFKVRILNGPRSTSICSSRTSTSSRLRSRRSQR